LEQQEIYLLIIRHLNAKSSIEEDQFLTDWLQRSAENAQTFSAIKEIWATERISDEKIISDGLNNVKNKIAKRRKTNYIKYAAAAAVIAIAIVFFNHKENYVEKSTLAGHVMHLNLPDGTRIHLAPQSKIRYRNREIILEGEAFFEVKENAHSPFKVTAGKMIINVLGTRFNVSDTAVSLLDGKVQVKVNNNTYTLQPGEQLSYNTKTEHCYQRTSALLIFRNETFASAALKIEKMYDVKIIFSDDETANSRLFAKFSNKPLTYVLDVIKASDNIDYEIKGKIVYITKIK
jgi:transmembrane sensor